MCRTEYRCRLDIILHVREGTGEVVVVVTALRVLIVDGNVVI